jgi:hypothetical protein
LHYRIFSKGLDMLRIFAPLVACGAVLFAPLTATATPIVSTDGGSLAVTTGSVYTVNVLIGATAGPGDDAVNLYGYQFSVSYDASVLSVQDPLNPAAEGSFFTNVYPLPGQTFFLSGFDDTVGGISFIANTLVGPLAGVSGSGTLASINFVAIADATTSVSAFFDAGNGDGLITTDDVTPVAAPEPATFLLVAGGCAFVARRRARRS